MATCYTALAAARRCAACRCCVVSLVAGNVGISAGSLGRGCSRNQGCCSASSQLMRFSCKAGEWGGRLSRADGKVC